MKMGGEAVIIEGSKYYWDCTLQLLGKGGGGGGHSALQDSIWMLIHAGTM